MSHDPVRLIHNFGEKHKANPKLKFIAEHKDKLIIERLKGTGFVNYIYLVKTVDGLHSAVIKYGEDHLSYEDNIGEDFIDLARQLLEYNCLEEINAIMPGGVAEPYALDQELHIIAMENLSHMEILGSALCRGEVNPQLGTKIGQILGRFQLNTHQKFVTGEKWQEFKEKLTHYEIQQRYLGYKFARCVEDDPFTMPPDVPLFREWKSVIESRGIFDSLQEMFKREDCLVHFDSHFFHVMFSPDRAVFLDFEIGCLGNHSLSLGGLMPFYYMATLDKRNIRAARMDDLIQETKSAMRNIVEAFLHEFGDNVDILGPQATFMSEFAAIFGHTLFDFPTFCVFHHFIQTDVSEATKFMEKGFKLMTEYQQISSLDEIFSTLFD